jgi:putative flippase GtrA
MGRSCAFWIVSPVLQRWIAFNGVGALGILVQLGTLALLVRQLNVPYLLATAIAVELTVLHNFVWHQRWTWRDRRSRSRLDVLTRLWRFHVLNGFVSLAGNLAIARVLTGEFGADPVASNIAAIIVCSMVNFAASEVLVFRRAAASLVLLLAVAPAAAAEAEPLAAELRPATLQAWTAYERRVDGRLQSVSSTSAPFFTLDAYGVAGWRDAAMSGGASMHRLDRPQPGGATVSVPDGKVHHWAGAIFVPGMTVDAVLQHLSTYAGRESQHYSDVIGSRLISREGDRYRVFMKLRRTKVVTVTYNSEHLVEYRRLSDARATGRSVSTRIAELENAGAPTEREKPEGRDQGFLWRLNAYWRYEAVKGGVLIECESISLSRDVPTMLKWFIGGMVEGVARESLERTLSSLKRALLETKAT